MHAPPPHTLTFPALLPFIPSNSYYKPETRGLDYEVGDWGYGVGGVLGVLGMLGRTSAVRPPALHTALPIV